jgi:hypothetical protein
VPDALKFEVLKVLGEYADVAGVGKSPGAAVTVQIGSGKHEVTPTLHVVKVKGRWRTFLKRADYERARRGRCA